MLPVSYLKYSFYYIKFIYDQVLSEQDAHIPTKNMAIAGVGASRSLLLYVIQFFHNKN